MVPALSMPVPAVFATVKVPLLVMVPELVLLMPILLLLKLFSIMISPVLKLSIVPEFLMPWPPVFDIVMVAELEMVELLVKEPVLPIISSEPFSIVSVPVVSVNGISSVTVTIPSMVMVSEPAGRVSLLQLSGSDQFTPSPPPSQTTIEIQTSTDGFPSIIPLITPVQSLFIVPRLLLMVPDVLLMVPELFIVPLLRMVLPGLMVMVPELLMVLSGTLSMPRPAVFDIVMMPVTKLSMVPPDWLMMPVPAGF